MLIYHGSGEIVRYPEIRIAGYTKDFSWGFYCTENLRQAVRWANRKPEPIINVYEYTPDDTLNILHFSEMNDEWLDFVAECRSGKTHRYDIVEGPMADDQIWDFLTQWETGLISRDELMMLAKFRHPTHQISFHTIASFDCIRFRRAIQYGQ
ncbi:MAG: DUF3990 domain-containing protein [Clostridia bacterium]|nr:DUF3990 domain-containing protein [Clostridia bacterium]